MRNTDIIAEIGVNFTSLTEARTMIVKAHNAGADAVKFQLYRPDQVKGHERYDELAKISKMLIDEKGIFKLKEYADNIDINLFATPMFPEAVDLLEDLQVDRYKIRYADRYNDELIQKIIYTGKPVVISCDGDYRLSVVGKHDAVQYMFCIPKYPPEQSDFVQFPRRFHNNPDTGFIGYSNHYPSIVPALMAVSRGCQILEMHVKREEGTKPIDDTVSITFKQLRELVKLVREIEGYL